MNEAETRLVIFLGLFLTLAVLEVLSPRRHVQPVKARRWFTNIAILVIDSVLVRLLFRTAAVGGALWAAQSGFGLFNIIAVPFWLAFAASFVVLDFAVWLEHVASHKVPLFWRIHRMHHSDTDFDITTALRFHPLEIILSMAWKYLVVLALGAPALSVLVFEIVLNGTAMFNHSNLKLPIALDKWVRLFVVTPDMHRIHHSTDRRETDSNYGFNLPVWDRLFGTYIAEPALGHDAMTIGLKEWQDDKPSRIDWALWLPFRNLNPVNKD